MKPIVVSAASAARPPKVVPSASAALPCNRCRREILPKSICLLPPAAGPPNISQPRRHGGAWERCRNLRASVRLASTVIQPIEYVILFVRNGSPFKFCAWIVCLIYRRHYLIVCKTVKQLLARN